MICPVCRGSVTVTTATVYELWHTGYHILESGQGLETRARLCVIAACNHCEHIHEIRGQTMKTTTTKKDWRGDRQRRAAAKAAKLAKVAKVAAPARKPADQSWRKRIDWVAAGQKAFASRKRNEAAAKRASKRAPASQPVAAAPAPASQPLVSGDQVTP